MKQMTLLLHYIVVPIKYRISKLYKYISGRPLSYEQTLNNVNTLNFYLHYTVSLSLGTDLIALFLYTSFINKFYKICDCRHGREGHHSGDRPHL